MPQSAFRWLLAFAATVGPFAVWLIWAIQSRRWGHVAAASTANLILWFWGPVLLAWLIRIKAGM